MKLSDRQKKIIDIIQWICIIFLLMVCITGSIFKKSDNDFVKDTEYQKEQTYVKIYESQTIERLKKENRELYDSIKRLNAVESACIAEKPPNEKLLPKIPNIDKSDINELQPKFIEPNNEVVLKFEKLIVIN